MPPSADTCCRRSECRTLRRTGMPRREHRDLVAVARRPARTRVSGPSQQTSRCPAFTDICGQGRQRIGDNLRHNRDILAAVKRPPNPPVVTAW